MVETQDDEVDTKVPGEGINVCCPRCKSRDVILKESKEGYFWIYLCNNCGYKGHEGLPAGCIGNDDKPRIRGG